MGNNNSALELKTGIRALLEQNYKLDDHAVWKCLFAARLLYIDFAVHISPDAVRFMRRCRPQNLAILLYKCVEQVEIFANKQGEIDAQSAKNALGVLARVLPFVFEAADARFIAAADSAQAAAGTASLVDERSSRHVDPNEPLPDTGVGEPTSPPTPYQPTPAALIQQEPPVSRYYVDFVRHVFADNCICAEENPAAKLPIKMRLGELLISSLVSVAFIPGFTIGAHQRGGFDPVPGHPMVDCGVLWCAGLATHPSAKIHWQEAHNINRRAVILALIAALSGELYRHDAMAVDPFHRTLTDLRACPTSVTLVCSLINFVIGYEPRGILPYTSHLITGAEDLALRCAQLLCVMADTACFYDEEVQKPVANGSDVAASPREVEKAAPEPPREADETAAKRLSDLEQQRVSTLPGPRTPHTHPFWVFFSNLSTPECTRVLRGLIKLAGNPTYAKSTLLPGSQRTVEYNDEYFILIWKLIDRCDNFLHTMCTQPDLVHELLVPLLDFGLEARQNDGRFSPMQLMMFILMRLSSVTDFATACNEPFNKWLPFDLPPFNGTYNDLLVLSLHTVLVCKHKWVQHVHLSAAMVINNLSAYITSLSQTASSKLTFLLELTSNPHYLEAKPERAQIFYYIAEGIANLVQYQFQASLHVVYGLVRQEKIVKGIFGALEAHSLPIPEEIAKKLHIGTLCCAIDAASPIVTAALSKDAHANVAERLGKATLVGRLPVPHRIITHHFESRPGTDAWLTSWLWSCVYVHAYQQFADAKQIQLFGLRH